jgi:TetR/AcrR family transcriptional regulator, cholesterol catabolism regulator
MPEPHGYGVGFLPIGRLTAAVAAYYRQFLAKLLRIKEPIPIEGKGKRASHIYRVAAEIMCQKGYEATSMNDIADAAGLTKAGIYHYIRGKEDLLFEIMNYAMDVVDQGIIAHASQIEDAEERLRAIIERHSRSVLEGVGALTVVLEEMTALTPAHRRTITARKRAYFEFIRGTLDQLAAEGKLRDISPTIAAFSLLGMILWISRWYRRDGSITVQAALKDYLEIGIHAVLK